jgi:hypothetical protein
MFVVLAAGALGVWSVLVGVQAMWTRKLRFVANGKTVYGALAQLCGVFLVAALPFSGLSCGEVAHLTGAGPELEADRQKVWKYLFEPDPKQPPEEREKTYQEFKSAAKQVFLGCAFDFAVLSIPFTILVWLIANARGSQPTRRRHRTLRMWPRIHADQRGSTRMQKKEFDQS